MALKAAGGSTVSLIGTMLRCGGGRQPFLSCAYLGMLIEEVQKLWFSWVGGSLRSSSAWCFVSIDVVAWFARRVLRDGRWLPCPLQVPPAWLGAQVDH